MASVLEFWRANKAFFQEKSAQQIISLSGDGKLRDNSSTSLEFRELLGNIASPLITRYAEECLQAPFENSGLALQDLVNEIGSRLGFQIKHGLYKGKVNSIGFDGIWSSPDGYQLVVEVKTTDTYRINLDTLASYRAALIDTAVLSKAKSSILIVVGRQDTGDLEAQIRGSRHAWDIRLISVEALAKLMSIKESLSDAKTAQQIAEVLKPLEYTRLDRLINIIFKTSEDLQTELPVEVVPEDPIVTTEVLAGAKKAPPASFHDQCVVKVSDALGISLVKEGRSRYTTPDKSVGVVCAVSKEYPRTNDIEYWYSFHPSQQKYLSSKGTAYVAYGCGSADKVVLIPYKEFEPLLKKMWTTEKEDRFYWHVHLFESETGFTLGQGSTGDPIDVTEYLLNK